MKSIYKLWLLLLFTVFAATSVQAADKTIGILVYDGVLTSDVTAPLEVFGVASRKTWFSDYKVKTVALEPVETITTEEGLTLKVDTWVGADETYDAFITTSAYDMKSVIKHAKLKKLIQETRTQGGFLASNCSGAFLLAESGVLDGKKATTWAGGEKEFKSEYPAVDVVFDANVVIDDRIVTSNGSVVSYQAALTLLKLMASQAKADEVAEVIQYSRMSSHSF